MISCLPLPYDLVVPDDSTLVPLAFMLRESVRAI